MALAGGRWGDSKMPIGRDFAEANESESDGSGQYFHQRYPVGSMSGLPHSMFFSKNHVVYSALILTYSYEKSDPQPVASPFPLLRFSRMEMVDDFMTDFRASRALFSG